MLQSPIEKLADKYEALIEKCDHPWDYIAYILDLLKEHKALIERDIREDIVYDIIEPLQDRLKQDTIIGIDTPDTNSVLDTIKLIIVPPPEKVGKFPDSE